MINRILIRIKVVQTLYSYLLVRKDFALESQPSSPTKEKRFAYALYLDMLVMMNYIAEGITKRGANPLLDSRFIKNVMEDDRMRSLKMKYSSHPFQLQPAVAPLTEKIKNSTIYKNYPKQTAENRDIDVWKEIFNNIILKDTELAALISRRENYTLRGVDRATELMEATFTNLYSSNGSIMEAVKMLDLSLAAARELYFRFLLLPIDLTDLRNLQLDENRHKYLPTQEDRNPNLRFVENQLVEAMRNDSLITDYVEDHKISWLSNDRNTLTALLKAILSSELYKNYMSDPVTDFHTDAEFWRNAFKQIIFRNENFLEDLEDKSVFWNDDIEIIGTFLLKTLKRFDEGVCHDTEQTNLAEGSEEPVLPMYKDEEDARFGRELLSASIRNKDLYRSYVDEFIDPTQWDTERLALMDVVILMAAIAEITNFPKIPASVSINEYIEIAKSYGSPRSASFIHGVLAKVIDKLHREHIISKK